MYTDHSSRNNEANPLEWMATQIIYAPRPFVAFLKTAAQMNDQHVQIGQIVHDVSCMSSPLRQRLSLGQKSSIGGR